jgi:biotin transport system substrate-specific component
MLRTLDFPRIQTPSARLIGIGVFALLTVIAARVTVEIGAVPITLQTLTVVLSGLILGARDGALSQLIYLGMIALNLPVDARMLGAAALAGPTAGYLIGFAPAAFAAGWLAERGRESMARRWLAGVVGMLIVYIFGAALLKLNTGMTWDAVWSAGIAPFIAIDMAKALIAAAAAEGGRAALKRMSG